MDTPQFQKVEYAGAHTPDSCKICGRPVGATYFRVNGTVACESCATQAKSAVPSDRRSNFTRGLIFGIGGAILGLIIYSTFSIATGIEIGYVSLAVGFIVGKAIKMGSKGYGGAHYQVAAAILTYAAVSIAAVPIAISQINHHPRTAARTQISVPADPSAANSSSNSQDADHAPVPTSNQAPAAPQSRPPLGLALAQLAFIGLASPFLELAQDPFNGLIGLVILLVGIRIAWKLTAGDDHAQIVGPFKNTAPQTAPPGLG